MRWFGNDTDGFNEKDFEKLVTGFLFIACVGAVIYKYLAANITNTDMIYLCAILGSLFVVRKGISYFKPDRYYQNTTGANIATVDAGRDDKEESQTQIL